MYKSRMGRHRDVIGPFCCIRDNLLLHSSQLGRQLLGPVPTAMNFAKPAHDIHAGTGNRLSEPNILIVLYIVTLKLIYLIFIHD